VDLRSSFRRQLERLSALRPLDRRRWFRVPAIGSDCGALFIFFDLLDHTSLNARRLLPEADPRADNLSMREFVFTQPRNHLPQWTDAVQRRRAFSSVYLCGRPNPDEPSKRERFLFVLTKPLDLAPRSCAVWSCVQLVPVTA
jgi:hypothetical protein